MSVVLSIACGHDASYPFKTTGAAEGPVITGQCGARYYLSAVEKGGEPGGTRQFGFEWGYRPASKGRAITGFLEKAIAHFSSRQAQITKTTLAFAYQREKDHGHALGQRAAASMGRFTNAMTRRVKGPGALDFAALLRDRERASRVAEREALRDLARTIWHATPRVSARTGARTDTRAELPRRVGWHAQRGELTHAQERAAVMAPISRGRKSREQAAALIGADLPQPQAQLHAGGAGG